MTTNKMATCNDSQPVLTDKPRKRKSSGSRKEREKIDRVKSHTTGEDCKCTRFACFTAVNSEERHQLLKKFNEYGSKDAQDSYLSTLINIQPVTRRRGRVEEPNFRSHSVNYCVKVVKESQAVAIPVCQKGFCAMFGITKNRLETIRKALATTGHPPTDGRGKHTHRPHKLKDEVRKAIHDHITSFRGRKSHYSRGQARRLYLPEELNISQMYQLFKEKHQAIDVSYETYRTIFNNDFNIGFGYPRKDTCSKCDELNLKIQHLDSLIVSADNEQELDLHKQRQSLTVELDLHQRKAEVFYSRKTAAKSRAQVNPEFEAIAFDFQKNLPIPNKTSNDVYYKRQLTFITFCIHVLSTDDVFMYVYDETVAKKGSDDVCSMLHSFITDHLSDSVTDVTFFCDGCAGQNKNFTVFRYFHHVVHTMKRLKSIKVCFPIRGHSYMECDRDMANVNCKADIEDPQGWKTELLKARQKPFPFNVITMEQGSFFAFSDYLKQDYKASCPFATRPIRELKIEFSKPNFMMIRSNWNGSFETVLVKKQVRKGRIPECHGALKISYSNPLPITRAKYDDLQELKKLCSPKSAIFFERLPTEENTFNNSDSDSEVSTNSDLDS